MLQKQFLPLLAAIVLGLTACEKDLVEPVPLPVVQQPNALPPNARIKQVKWSENDHLSAAYDHKNRITQLRSQWQYEENDPTKIRSIVYDFQYDGQDKVTRIAHTGGFVTNLYYNEQLIEKAQELFPGGEVLNDFTYLYNNKQISAIIQKRANAPGEASTFFKHELSYDGRGNLIRIKTLEKLNQPENGNSYKLLETTTFSDFDDKINPMHWHWHFPWMPQVRWQFNNPRRKEIKIEGGSTQVFTYTYRYNTSGLPVEQREDVNGYTKTAEIIY